VFVSDVCDPLLIHTTRPLSCTVARLNIIRRELADSTTYSQPVRRQIIQHLINTSMLIGGGVAGLLSLTTYFQRDSILAGLTSNAAIRDASAAIFPVVLVTQTLKGRTWLLLVPCEAVR
jgi:hypothetical protein